MPDGLHSNVKGWESSLPHDSHLCKPRSFSARHFFSFYGPAVKGCISMDSKWPSSSLDQHGQRCWVQCTCPAEGFSICHCSGLQHTSKIGTWQTKLTECIAKQNILPSPNTRTACYRALANSWVNFIYYTLERSWRISKDKICVCQAAFLIFIGPDPHVPHQQ